jgi:hypothetical protein
VSQTLGSELIYLLEADVYNPSTNEVEQIFACTGNGYTTSPLDVYPSRVYQPRLALPADIRRYVFDDGKTGGASVTDLGTARLRNVDGFYDYLVEDDYGLDGRDARVLIGYQDWPRSRFVTLMVATMEGMEMIFRQDGEDGYECYADLRFADPITLFDKPIAQSKYAGTNSGPTGIEGTADDLKGLPKPITKGTVSNVSVRMVNTSKLIAQVNDGPVGGIPAVYDDAVGLINDGDLATLVLLQAWTPVSGHYKTCLALGLFILGANPAGTITADVVQVGTSASGGAGGEAVTFDGTGHVAYRGSFSGVTTDAAGVLFSAWVRIDSGNGTNRTIFAGHNGASGGYYGVRVWLDTSNRINVDVRANSSGGGSAISFRSNSGYSSGSTWRHIAWHAYLNTPAASMSYSLYVDGASVATTAVSVVGPGAKIDITLAYWSVAGRYVPASGYDQTAGISVAELWFDDDWRNLTTDPSVVTRFRTSDGYPAELGSSGQAALGASPIVYLRGGPSSFLVNYGTGGAFSETGGTLVTADSSPYRSVVVVTSAPTPVGEIARDIVRNISGLPDSSFDYQSIARFEADAPQGVGIYVDEERNVREVLDDLYNSVAGWYGFTREKKFTSGKLQLPLEEPTLSLAEADILSLEMLQTGDDGRGVPAYSVTVDYGKNYTVQTDGIGAATDERRAYLAQEYRKSRPAADNSILGAHPRAIEVPFVTLMTSADDADAFAIDRLAVYSRRRPRLRLQIKLTPDTAIVELGDAVDVTIGRFGLARGHRFMVLGVGYLTENDRIELDLWGGEPLPPTSSILVWLRGDYTTQSGGKVSSMRDKTGGSNDWTNSDASNRPSPIDEVEAINYQPAVSFDMTDYLQSTNGIPFSADDAKTVYAVMRATGFRLNDGTLYLNAALVHDISGTGTFGLYLRSAAPRLLGVVNDGSVKSVSQDLAQDEWVAVEFAHDPTGIEMRRHDVAVPSRVSAGGSQTLFEWAIGLNTSTALDADIAEILVYDKTLTQVERERVRSYIKARYGIGFEADGPPIGPRMWLRGDSVTEVSTAVEYWTDKTGLGRDFEQATGGSKPIYHAADSDINDQPCVEFDGSADHMTAVANINLGKIINQSTFTLYLVLKVDTTGSGEAPFSAEGILDILTVPSHQIVVSHSDGAADSVSAAITTGDWEMVEAFHDGDRLYMRTMDVDYTSVASAGTSSLAVVPTIGRKNTAYFDGRIAEIIVYDALLSEEDRQAVRDYLEARYDLAWTNFPESAAAVLAGAGSMLVHATALVASPVAPAAWYNTEGMSGSQSGLYFDVGAIPDKSGNSLTLLANIYLATYGPTGTIDPAFGYQELLGDDDGDGAYRTGEATTSYISATAYTIYGVAKVSAAAQLGDTILEIGSNDGGSEEGAIQVYVDPTTNPCTLVFRDMTSEARVQLPGTDIWFAFEAVKTGGVLRLATSAGSYDWVTAGSTTTTNPGFTLGYRLKDGSRAFRGSIAEVFTYTTALSSGNQTLSRRYLSDRYGFVWAAEPIARLRGSGGAAAALSARQGAAAVLPGVGSLGVTIPPPPTLWSASASLVTHGHIIAGTGEVLPAATGWWAADRGSLATGGIDFLRDKSGNSRDLRQSTADLRPTLNLNLAAINDQASADFPWTDLGGGDYDYHHFTGSSSFATSVLSLTAGTVYIVFKARGSTTNQNAANRNNNSRIYRLGNTYLTIASTGAVRPVYRNGSTNVETEHTISFGTWYMLEIRHDGTNLHSMINTSATEQSAAVASWSTSSTVEVPGVGSLGFDGEIAEMITYNTDLASGARTAVKNYLATKYGLSWT